MEPQEATATESNSNQFVL